MNDQSVVFAVEEFYKSSKNIYLSAAAVGWFFTDSFDRYFMKNKLSKLEVAHEIHIPQQNELFVKNEDNINHLDSGQIIKMLNNENDISKKYYGLKKLISSNDINLINDSFGVDIGSDFAYVQEQTFDTKNINIVIIGAGVCGLFLANNMKYVFGDIANVLILDNRSKQLNTREPFTREWLTHIRAYLFQNYTPPNIRSLIESYGTNGLIGIPINLLEAVLMLSCKDQGVNFYFSPSIEYSALDSDVVDLVFDATGGRLSECDYSTLNSSEMLVNIPNFDIDLKDAGVNQLHNTPDIETGHLDVILKPHGVFHYPHIGDSQIYTHMLKLTGIPQNLMKIVLNYIEPINSLNLFYVWNGNLKKEINEGLILINLLNKESEFFTSAINKPIKLKCFLSDNPDISKHLNENIISMFQTLLTSDRNSPIKIERPFIYLPYVNLNAGLGTLKGKRVFPIGDSLFCGNPKKGNGLASHLIFINNLLKNMIKQ